MHTHTRCVKGPFQLHRLPGCYQLHSLRAGPGHGMGTVSAAWPCRQCFGPVLEPAQARHPEPDSVGQLLHAACAGSAFEITALRRRHALWNGRKGSATLTASWPCCCLLGQGMTDTSPTSKARCGRAAPRSGAPAASCACTRKTFSCVTFSSRCEGDELEGVEEWTHHKGCRCRLEHASHP